MDDIAKELLMTKGALYYYFRDKEDILYACHDYSLSLVLENLSQVEASGASNEVKLRELIKAHVHVMLDALQGSAMALDFNALSPHLLEIIIAKRDKFERGMRRLIADGMSDGSFAAGDEKLAAFMILGAINWVTKWYREGGRYDG
jgi:AcrR family transcriptional regulator